MIAETNGYSQFYVGPDDVPMRGIPISNEIREAIYNSTMYQRAILQMFTDRHKNVEAECGYPQDSELTVERYKKLYNREPIAKRVNDLLPNACWSVNPEICETQDLEQITPFEQALEDLGKKLNGPGFFKANDEQGNPLWDYLYRADSRSGIGQYGVILLGFDDVKVGGRSLADPVDLLNPEELQQQGEDAPEELPSEGGIDNPDEEAGAKDETEEDVEEDGDKKPVGNFGGPPDAGGGMPPPVAKPKLSSTSFQADKQEAELVGPEWKPKVKLNFIRVLDEELAPISSYVTDESSPRFGLPEYYSLTLNDATVLPSGTPSASIPGGQKQDGKATTTATVTVKVHWSRVIHIADNKECNEVLGAPRMRTTYNRLYDLHKLYGGSAEMYWKGAFFGIAFSVDPKLAVAKVDVTAIKQQIERWESGLQRWLGGTPGVNATSLAPQVVSPVDHIDAQIEAICVDLEVPKRIFMGSERGELASSQDARNWLSKVKARQNKHVTFNIIVPFIDRLILAQVLPVPEQYSCDWPDVATLTELERAQVALARMQAYSAYMSGGVSDLMEPRDLYVREMGYSDDEAVEMLSAKAAIVEEEELIAEEEEAQRQSDMEAAGLKGEEEAGRAADLEERDMQVKETTAKAKIDAIKKGAKAKKAPKKKS